MSIIGISSLLVGCILTFFGYVESLNAKNATTGGWGGPQERYIDYSALHTAEIVTFIGVTLIIIGIVFLLVKLINKKDNKENAIKCLKCGNIVNLEQAFCSKCGNDLHNQQNFDQLPNVDIYKNRT